MILNQRLVALGLLVILSPFVIMLLGVRQAVQPLTLLITVTIAGLLIYCGMRKKKEAMPTPPPPPSSKPETQPPSFREVVRKEITRKEVIVKIRCSYCNTLFDETLDRCPHCGATH